VTSTDSVELPTAPETAEPISVSVVIPVYAGATTVPALIEELGALTTPRMTAGGTCFQVAEVILVWDHGPDHSDQVITELTERLPWVRAVWLSRNYGQHPATVAGISASRGDWVVTMDEDGQHDPADIARLIDTAFSARSSLVYAAPSNPPPHSFLRNIASSMTKGVVLRWLSGGESTPFHSFRLIHGEHARAVAAFCGPGVYLDVALGWVVGGATSCPVAMRDEGRAASSYNVRRLSSHFWRLVISSGNRPLRIVSGAGLLTAVLGIVLALVLAVQRLAGDTVPQGWTSVIVAVLIIGGLVLTSLGVIAEYVGLAAGMSMGKPLFVAISRPSPFSEDVRRS
jgi:glycosyltransferase involved in cell wall biosynthesis